VVSVVDSNVVCASEAESLLLAFARGQHGAVSWGQIERAGFGERWVRSRVATGWLQRLYRGVYLVGPLEGPHSRAMAAVLAAGADGLLSHYPGAVLFGLRPPREGPIDVTVPDRRVRSRPGLRVHHATVHPRDITRHHGIPVTSPARILLDLAATEPSTELDRALNEARSLRLVSGPSLTEQFSRYPRHRGTAALRKATQADTGFTRSEAERQALKLIRRAGLPTPECNAKVHGYEVDLLWRDLRLIVEIDGYAFHSMRSSFEQDRRRDQQLTANGYRVIRITWRQLIDEPEAVLVTLTRALFAPR
jgi:very-short-patch-repair endonuclease